MGTLGAAQEFTDSRALAAWLGLVPCHQASGGQCVLLGISKRGNRYLRTLLIHGACAVVRVAGGKNDARSRWIQQLTARRGCNVATAALAHKNARIAWALLNRGESYRQAA